MDRLSLYISYAFRSFMRGRSRSLFGTFCVAIGVAGALVSVRVIASELYGIKPSDPVTFVSAVLAILIVGGLACWIPARRAPACS